MASIGETICELYCRFNGSVALASMKFAEDMRQNEEAQRSCRECSMRPFCCCVRSKCAFDLSGIHDWLFMGPVPEQRRQRPFAEVYNGADLKAQSTASVFAMQAP
jgi:hypothetical protein